MIYRRSDNLLRFKGPVDVLNNTAISAGATCTFNLYDERKQGKVAPFVTRARQSAAAGQPDIEVPYFVPEMIVAAGPVFRIVYDNGSEELLTMLSKATTLGNLYETLTFSSNLSYAIDTGTKLYLEQFAGSYVPVVFPDQEPDIGDTVEFELSDFTTQQDTVDGTHYSYAQERAPGDDDLPEAANQNEYRVLEVAAGIAPPDSLLVHSRVRTLVAGPLTANLYGTPAVGSDEWGYAAILPDTTALEVGQKLRVEVSFDGGAGLAWSESWVEEVVE